MGLSPEQQTSDKTGKYNRKVPATGTMSQNRLQEESSLSQQAVRESQLNVRRERVE